MNTRLSAGSFDFPSSDRLSFRSLLFDAGLADTVSASRVFGVSERTIHRWRSTNRPPVAVWRLAWVLAGNLPFPGWRGWVIDGGHLFAPGQTRRGFLPSEVEVFFVYRRLAEVRGRTIERLEAENRCLLARLRDAGVPLD